MSYYQSLDETAENAEDQGWEYHSVGDGKQFGIRTSGLEEKATACEMIVCYARDMKGAKLVVQDFFFQNVLLHMLKRLLK